MTVARPTHECGWGRVHSRRFRRPWSALWSVGSILLGLVVSSCATPRGLEGPPPPRVIGTQFEVGRHTFAFANLVRAENPAKNGRFANYCIIMSRAANQFFRFARFDPAAPPGTPDAYARLVGEVMAIGPWEPPRPDDQRIVIPGYADLYTFSRAHEALIKAEFGSNVWSMVHWRTWRVAFDLSAEHQAGVARELTEEVGADRPVSLMITNYPEPDLLNHAVLVYDYRVHAGVVEFLAYDPNDSGSPLSLHFDLETRGFWVEPLPYSPPGPIRAFRLYRSPLL